MDYYSDIKARLKKRDEAERLKAQVSDQEWTLKSVVPLGFFVIGVLMAMWMVAK
jgi:hypothetical protein